MPVAPDREEGRAVRLRERPVAQRCAQHLQLTGDGLSDMPKAQNTYPHADRLAQRKLMRRQPAALAHEAVGVGKVAGGAQNQP